MPIDVSKRLVALGVEAAQRLPSKVIDGGHIGDADLWILTQGFAGAFYAIWESLYSVQHNDPVFKAVLDEMRPALKSEYDAVAGVLRKQLSHKAFTATTQSIVEWEENWLNDTIEPVYTHVFAEVVSPMTSKQVTFNEWAQIIMNWWGNKMAEIERVYNRRKANQARLSKTGGKDK